MTCRRGDEIGLAFTETEAIATTPQESELIQRVAHFEGEVAALRRTLKQMKCGNACDGEIEAA